jgi:hypothetical protein
MRKNSEQNLLNRSHNKLQSVWIPERVLQVGLIALLHTGAVLATFVCLEKDLLVHCSKLTLKIKH